MTLEGKIEHAMPLEGGGGGRDITTTVSTYAIKQHTQHTHHISSYLQCCKLGRVSTGKNIGKKGSRLIWYSTTCDLQSFMLV